MKEWQATGMGYHRLDFIFYLWLVVLDTYYSAMPEANETLGHRANQGLFEKTSAAGRDREPGK